MNKKTTEKSKVLRVTCDTKLEIPLDQLNELQGDLKEMLEPDYVKFRKLVLKKGIWFASHVWKEFQVPHSKSEAKRLEHSGKKRFFKYWIVDGTGRARMLRKMRDEGYTVPNVPCVEIQAKNISEAKEAILAGSSRFHRTTGQGLYKFVEEAGFQPEIIRDEFEVVDVHAKKWLDEFYRDPESEEAEDARDALPENVPVVSVQGDVWTLGEHRLVCGDSTDLGTLELAMLKGEEADLVVTDPPYNIIGRRNAGIVTACPTQKAYKKMSDDGWDENFEITKVLSAFGSLTSENASIYVFTSQFLAGEIWDWFETWSGFADFCIWTKSNPMPSLQKRGWTSACELIAYSRKGKHVFNFPDEGHCMNYFNFAKPMHGRVHPTQKPVKLVEYLIEKSSRPGQVVLDPFGGSGTTLMACESTARKARMVEREPKYCDVILERYFLETKKNPVRKDGVKWSELRKIKPSTAS